ncbi:MAG TPA: GIY-YIG nuclease family protein [Steroidobacteraceae bacterium]|jgi:hypothetical protein|nr:GIY-YIG nuclease family protein [Steroidobacteraceae bacterium]
MTSSPTTSREQLTRRIRANFNSLLLDCSDAEPAEVAIYTLADPRDIRQVRYVGQSTRPDRRYLQHISQARLWEPAETPWWIKKPQLRPLYQWIRELYAEEQRLPVMMIIAWTQQDNALHEERRHITEYLNAKLLLLNYVVDRDVP